MHRRGLKLMNFARQHVHVEKPVFIWKLMTDHRNYICDSEEYDADAKPVKYKCIECGSSTANMGVGFSLYGDDGEIRWLYVGVRCTECGVLGCFAGWKIAYSPSKQLMEHV